MIKEIADAKLEDGTIFVNVFAEEKN